MLSKRCQEESNKGFKRDSTCTSPKPSAIHDPSFLQPQTVSNILQMALTNSSFCNSTFRPAIRTVANFPIFWTSSFNRGRHERNNLPIEDALGAPRPQLTMSESPCYHRSLYHKPLCLRHCGYIYLLRTMAGVSQDYGFLMNHYQENKSWLNS